MRKMLRLLVISALTLALPLASIAFAQTAEELAAESIAKAKATESVKATPAMIVEKVDKAAGLVEKEGPAAFPKFKGKDSDFIFAGTYLWVHEMNSGIARMHAVNPKLEGKELNNLRDANGKLFFAEMNIVVRDNGSGWVEYSWPKAGEKTPSTKVSYVKLAKHGGIDYVVGCGVYDMTLEQVKAALGKK